MKCCINGGNIIRLLFLSAKLLKFEIKKCGQILCAHKPYFLMPGHIFVCLKQSMILIISVIQPILLLLVSAVCVVCYIDFMVCICVHKYINMHGSLN